MSISRFQEKFLGQGCVKVVTIGMAAVFVGSAFYTCGQAGRLDRGEGARSSGINVATVAGAPVSLDDLQRGIKSDTQQMLGQASQPGMSPPELTPGIEVLITGGSITNALKRAAVLAIAQKEGVDFSDEKLKAAAAKEFDTQMEQAKMQLMSSGKIKFGATDKEFDEAVKKQSGKSVAELRAAQTVQVENILGDPAQRANLVAAFAGPLYTEAASAKILVTNEELKRSYDTITIKQILFRDLGGKDDVKARAGKVLTELKGGLKFEDAMNRYSSDTPQKGKKVSENTVAIPSSEIDTVESYKVLKGMKVGFLSDVVSVPTGAAIYKITDVKSNAPADFDKNVAKYRDEYTKRTTSQELEKKIKVLVEGPDVKWISPGYQALFMYSELNSPTATGSRDERLKSIVELAKKAMKEGREGDAHPAALAYYSAFEQIYSAAPDKAKLRDERIESIQAVLQTSEDGQLRLDLTDLFIEKKDGENAASNLLMASQANGDFSAQGQRRFGDIASRVEKLRQAKLLPPQAEKDIMAAQDAWRQNKTLSDQAAAEEKKRQEEEMKKAAEEQKKADAAAAAAKKKPITVKDAPTTGLSPKIPDPSAKPGGKQ